MSCDPTLGTGRRRRSAWAIGLLVGWSVLLACAALAASGSLRPAPGSGVAVLTATPVPTYGLTRRYTSRTSVEPSAIRPGQALRMVSDSVDQQALTVGNCVPSTTDTTDPQAYWLLTRVEPGKDVNLSSTDGANLQGTGTIHRVRVVVCGDPAKNEVTTEESETIDVSVPASETTLLTPGCYVVFPGYNAHLLEGTWDGTLAAVSVGGASCTSATVPGGGVSGSVVSGLVTVKLPGSPTPVPLRAGQTIPAGSVVNATAGAVRLKGAAGKNVVFSKGAFKVGSAGPVSELALAGGDFSMCKKRKLSGVGASQPRLIRTLWGDGKGRFRTRGRFAAATVRGTAWEIADACGGTIVHVRRGVVEVRDLRRGKVTVVRAGGSVTIPA